MDRKESHFPVNGQRSCTYLLLPTRSKSHLHFLSRKILKAAEAGSLDAFRQLNPWHEIGATLADSTRDGATPDVKEAAEILRANKQLALDVVENGAKLDGPLTDSEKGAENVVAAFAWAQDAETLRALHKISGDRFKTLWVYGFLKGAPVNIKCVMLHDPETSSGQ